MPINTARLESILQTFVTGATDVQGATLITLDGLPLVSYLPTSMDEERTAAMSAALLSLGERIGSELCRGTVERLFIEGDKGYCVLTACGTEAVFLVLAAPTARQGVLMLDIKRTLAELRETLGGASAPPNSHGGMFSASIR